MPFKCFTCGLTFDTTEEFIKHKLSHKEQPKKGPICLRCGKPIPLDSSKANYRGNIVCPDCGQTMKVVMQDGEVVVAVLKEE
jgi:DNA-directed RNA polymerase subunit RPC12/RpoP